MAQIEELLTPEQFYKMLFRWMAKLCEKVNWGDPFSYARSKEIYASIKLGHKVSETLSGADAYTKDGKPLEYKSTIQKHCKGAYTGISVQDTWAAQKEYLVNEKIGYYPEHYYNRFEGGNFVESWKLLGNQVLDILIPKLEQSYPTRRSRKDPRLAATVTWKEIQKYGKQVI